jgi:hypothetical protein
LAFNISINPSIFFHITFDSQLGKLAVFAYLTAAATLFFFYYVGLILKKNKN